MEWGYEEDRNSENLNRHESQLVDCRDLLSEKETIGYHLLNKVALWAKAFAKNKRIIHFV